MHPPFFHPHGLKGDVCVLQMQPCHLPAQTEVGTQPPPQLRAAHQHPLWLCDNVAPASETLSTSFPTAALLFLLGGTGTPLFFSLLFPKHLHRNGRTAFSPPGIALCSASFSSPPLLSLPPFLSFNLPLLIWNTKPLHHSVYTAKPIA